MARISGPLLDRIDLHIEVLAVEYKELASKETKECSIIRNIIIGHTNILQTRFSRRRLIEDSNHELGLFTRVYNRILNSARTIADLDSASSVRTRTHQ